MLIESHLVYCAFRWEARRNMSCFTYWSLRGTVWIQNLSFYQVCISPTATTPTDAFVRPLPSAPWTEIRRVTKNGVQRWSESQLWTGFSLNSFRRPTSKWQLRRSRYQRRHGKKLAPKRHWDCRKFSATAAPGPSIGQTSRHFSSIPFFGREVKPGFLGVAILETGVGPNRSKQNN